MRKNCGSGASKKIKTKLACILEASESTRLRMGQSLPTHCEDHIAGKGDNSLQHCNLVHKFYSYAPSHENSRSKGRSGQGMGKLEKKSAWNLTKVRSKKEVIDEAGTKGIKVHFASLMDICHLKNAELEAKHQKYKGRVVLRGDIVKDDSGSYAVFTESWTRPSAPGRGDTSEALAPARSRVDHKMWLPGRYRLGHRSYSLEEGRWLNVQAAQRKF